MKDWRAEILIPVVYQIFLLCHRNQNEAEFPLTSYLMSSVTPLWEAKGLVFQRR
jgi:hypothetical protein